MEFTKMGNPLWTLIKWHTMDERPTRDDFYIVIWHTKTGKYLLKEIIYSPKYGLWGTYDGAKDAREAVKMADRGIPEDELVGWIDANFTEFFNDDEGDDF